MLSNPPWERIKLQEQEFFAARDPRIAMAANKAARSRLITELIQKNPALHAEFIAAVHAADCVSKFLRQSERFPLTATGDINTYAVFAETIRHLLGPAGRACVILPTGIATDSTCQRFFADLNEKRALASLFDFENRGHLFTALHTKTKFCLITLSTEPVLASQFAFFCQIIRHLSDQRRRFTLAPEELELLNPNTRTCPIFRTRADAELTRKIYQRVPVLIRDGQSDGNPWDISFMRMFDMANDSGLFRSAPGDGLLPLYEAKMVWHFDHRFSTYEGATQQQLNAGSLPQLTLAQKANTSFRVMPRYWIPEPDVLNRVAPLINEEQESRDSIQRPELERRQRTRTPHFLLGFRDVTDSRNERSAVFSLLPLVAVGHKLPLVFIGDSFGAEHLLCFLANVNSLVFDYVVRQKIGAMSLSYFILKQIPVLPPSSYKPADVAHVGSRVLELVYTADDMQPLADTLRASSSSLAGTVPRTPYRWDEARRALLRAELDAWFARAYGLTRDELRYILDPADVYGPDFPGETFRVLKEKETAKLGEYRTRRLVLEAWDKLPSS